MTTKTFIKPSGMELDVNEASWSHALSLGWIPKESVQEERETPAVPALTSEEPRQKRKYTRRADK